MASVHFGSEKMDWATPPELFAAVFALLPENR